MFGLASDAPGTPAGHTMVAWALEALTFRVVLVVIDHLGPGPFLNTVFFHLCGTGACPPSSSLSAAWPESMHVRYCAHLLVKDWSGGLTGSPGSAQTLHSCGQHGHQCGSGRAR